MIGHVTTTVQNILSPQVWVPFAVGFGAVLIIVIVALLVRGSYRKSTRRVIERMIQEKEAIRALVGGVTEARRRGDATGLIDLKTRAEIIVDELDLMPAPKKLIPLVEALADIAFLIEDELRTINEQATPQLSLAMLAALDTNHLGELLLSAEERLDQYALLYGIAEVAVYKGGLYV